MNILARDYRILITGAGRGIGRGIFDELKPLGRVYVSGRNEALLKDCCADGYCICDLASGTKPLEDFILEKKINVLINNAGIYTYGKIEDMDSKQIEEIFKVNLLAPVNLIKSAVKNMKAENFGRIINIGSISGVMGEANASLYSASKSGLIGLTRALALELAQYKITVNTINPGWVDTELGNNSIDESEFSKDEILSTIPQRRFVEPSEIANLCRYLISDEARGITGQSINLCAGLSVGI